MSDPLEIFLNGLDKRNNEEWILYDGFEPKSGEFGFIKAERKIKNKIKYQGKDVDICLTKKVLKYKFREMEPRILDVFFCQAHTTNYYGCEIDDDYIYIYTEYLENFISLEDLLLKGKLKEDEIFKLFEDMALVLKEIHEEKITHRNINDSSILFLLNNRVSKQDDFIKIVNNIGSIKFIDFGIAIIREKGGSKYTSYTGSDAYVAPEVKLRSKIESRKSDVYSLGCVLIRMAGGELNIKGGIPGVPSNISNRLKNIIQRCITENKDARVKKTISFEKRKLKAINPFSDRYIELELENEPFSIGTIPNGVKGVKLVSFNQEIYFDTIPTSVIYLDLGDDFDIKENGQDLPTDSIKTLRCGFNFTTPINSRSLPRSITDLQLHNYNQPINKNSIPNTVSYLTLGNNFTHIESLSNLPQSIINIEFGLSEKDYSDTIVNYIRFLSVSSLIVNKKQVLFESFEKPISNVLENFEKSISKNGYYVHNDSDWIQLKTLGRGATGIVFVAKKKDHLRNEIPVEVCAIKKIFKPKFKIVEGDILRQLNDNIYSTKYYGCGEDDEGNIYIYMEYIEGAISIKDKIKQQGPFTEKEVGDLIVDITLGLQSIHKKNIVHRDIKGDNILLIYNDTRSKPAIKFIDFGYSKLFTDEFHFKTVVGTDPFMAPEVRDPKGLATVKSDIYSLGCTIIEMLGGNIYNLDLKPIEKIPKEISPRFKNFIQKCIIEDTNARIDMKNLIDLLSNIIDPKSEIDHFYNETFNMPLKIGTIPNGIKKITLPSFDNEIEVGSIPSTVEEISFKNFNQHIPFDSIPSSVSYLNLGNLFDIQSDYSEDLPINSIKILRCGFKFIKPINHQKIAKSITNLQLHNYNIPIKPNSIPDSVSFLTLGNSLSSEAIKSLTNLPESIIDLSFGTNDSVDNEVIKQSINKSITSVKVNGNEILY